MISFDVEDGSCSRQRLFYGSQYRMERDRAMSESMMEGQPFVVKKRRSRQDDVDAQNDIKGNP